MTTDSPPSAERDGTEAIPWRSETHSPVAVDTLKQAMRRARFDNAERASVVADLRSARLGRLELLAEALKPLIAQIPADIDTFDIGLMPSGNPRLFIDMIGFVEMGRDARQYRLLQDTRTGRLVLLESGEIGAIVEAVTDYVARRLLEREKALAADAMATSPTATDPLVGLGRANGGADLATRRRSGQNDAPTRTSTASSSALTRADAALARPARGLRLLAIAFSFLIDLLGSIALFAILAALGWFGWTKLHAGM